MNGDAQTIAALRERGDPIEVARSVKHWAYFSSRDGTRFYTNWLASEELEAFEIVHEPDRDDLEWRVTYEHTIVPDLATITAHTDRAAVKAELFGGQYDGWETSVEAS